MKKVLAYLDSPTCTTGFATVARNVLDQLWQTNEYEIEVIGINYHGGWHPSGLVERYKIDPAKNNPYGDIFGTEKLIKTIQRCDHDILFTLHNLERPVIVEIARLYKAWREAKVNNPDLTPLPKWIHYFPIDSETCSAHNVVLEYVDYPVCYCKYAYDKVVDSYPKYKDKLRIIPHGVNLNEFFPSNEDKADLKEKMIGKEYRNKFLITNVNRFIQRKDVSRSMLVFREFKKLVPEAVFYPHCDPDREEMGRIADHARFLGLKDKEIIYNDTKYFSPNQGYSTNGIRLIYQASDVIVSTTLGEGWGFSATEAMACKIPIIFPRNTTFPWLIGDEERGYLADSGKMVSEWIVMPEDNGLWRPLTNIESMIKKLYYLYTHPVETQKKVDAAYDWIQSFNWDKVCVLWKDLFKEALK